MNKIYSLISVFILLVLHFCCSIAQVSEEWTQIYSFDSLSEETLYSFQTDPSGNSYAFGSCFSTTYKSVLLKYNEAGNLVWTYFIDSSVGKRIILDDSSNIICASWKYTFASGDSSIISKIDSNGNLIWQRTFYGANPKDIEIDHNENILIIADFTFMNSNGDPRILLMLNPAGGLLWSVSFDLNYEEDDGPFIRIGTDNSIHVLTEQFELLKFNSVGNLLWDIDIPGNSQSTYCYKEGCGINSQNDIFITGTTEDYYNLISPLLTISMIDSGGNIAWIDTITDLFEGRLVVPSSNGVVLIGRDTAFGLHCLKFDLYGTVIYNHLIDQNDLHLVPTDYALDESGNIYLVGYDNANIGYAGFATMKIDSGGFFQWITSKDGFSSGNSYEHSLISLDANNNIYCSNTGNSNFPNIPVYDITTVKYLQGLNGINPANLKKKFSIFPNPGEDQLILTLPDLDFTNSEIEIVDQYARILKTVETSHSSSSQITLITDDWANGIYFISLISENEKFTQKWVKLKR